MCDWTLALRQWREGITSCSATAKPKNSVCDVQCDLLIGEVCGYNAVFTRMSV